MVPSRAKHIEIGDRVTYKDDHWWVVGVVDDEPSLDGEEESEHVQYVVAKRKAGSFIEKSNILLEDLEDWKSGSTIAHEKRMAKLKEMKEDGTMDRLREEFIEKMTKANSTREYHKAKILGFIESLKKDEFESMVKRFFEWEEKYEEMWYTKRQTLTNSLIFSVIVDIWEDQGEWEERYEMFTHGGNIYKGYEIQTHCGQGCFHRVLKDGETVFQTT